MSGEQNLRKGSTWAAVVAAGQGLRMRAGVAPGAPRKPFMTIGGKAMVVVTLEAISRCPEVEGVVLAVAGDDVATAKELIAGREDELRVRSVIAGGERRQDTVSLALNEIPDDVEFAAVHDGARPLVSPELFGRVIESARETGAACAALPCFETIKRVDEHGVITETVDRSSLWNAQTPQIFPRAKLAELLEVAASDGVEVTDDTALFDANGLPVAAVKGERVNIKITTPEDLKLAEAIMSAGRRAGGAGEAAMVGHGYDIHPLVTGRRLVVCGVELESDVGADGHSDADVAAHAVIDSLLGAAALGDIGRLFPDSDPAYKDADSMKLLATVRDKLSDAGFTPVSVDVTILLERPKVSPHVDQMVRGLSEAAGIPLDRVNIKAKTMNGIGEVGRGEAVSSEATAVVRRT